jgi:D-aspartate ligase
MAVEAAIPSKIPPAMVELPKNQVGAVVLGGDYQGLGIVRSLGRRGIPVCVVDDEHSIARFSRYATHAIKMPDLRVERETVDQVMELGRRMGLQGWVLFPTRDETVAAFSRYRSVLTECFRVPTPEWSSVQWTWDKRNTYRLARELNIPTPRTWCPSSLDDLRKIDAEFPLALKPAIKEHFFYATKAKAWRANNRAELESLFQRAASLVGPGEVMIQDLVPGNGDQQFAYCAFFKANQALGSLVARRMRQHPLEFGRASTFVETTDVPELEAYSERFLQAINYYGLVELEYKRDMRDGSFKLLDVNARTWGYHTIGLEAGVDFPYLLFADQLGVPAEPCRGRPGVGWIRLVTDFPAAATQIMAGKLNWRAYLRSLKSFQVEAVFCREDPLPGLAELALLPYLMVKRGF